MDPDLHMSAHQPEVSRLPARRGFVDNRQEEVDLFNHILNEHLPSSVHTWTCDEDGWKFEYRDVVVAVNNDESATLTVDASSHTMHRRFLDGMRKQLREVLRHMKEVDHTPAGFAVKLLELCEEAASWEQLWLKQMLERAKQNDLRKFERKKRIEHAHGWNVAEIQSYESIVDHPFGVNVFTIEDTAQHLLKESLSEICSRISDDFRVLHAEPVFRDDLSKKFFSRQGHIRQHLLSMPYQALRQSVSRSAVPAGSRDDTLEGLADELCRPHVTFHGAPRHVVESIVRYGFIIPGSQIGHTGEILEKRCGSTWGMGIYSSPDPMYASHYLTYKGPISTTITNPADVPGMRLIVCATLMGRPMIPSSRRRWLTATESDQCHSHVSPNRLEYIVFEIAQIIPVYVLHLDYGAEHARQMCDKILKDPIQFFKNRQQNKTPGDRMNRLDIEPPTCPGDVQRIKQAKKAAAAKWFPYGYGPVEGTKFVIEEIGEISDDEEVYGEFQGQRIEQESEVREYVTAQQGSWLDSYQTARYTSYDIKSTDR